MTKTTKPESAGSQMNRLDHAIQSKEAEIVNDGLKAVVKSESETASHKR